MIEYFVEVPNNGIQEPVRTREDAYSICYDLAQEFGFAEVWNWLKIVSEY